MANERGIVFGACSSLKKSYRDCITKTANEPVCFIFLNGSIGLIKERVSLRKNHFMPTKLLDSQFSDLEEPAPGELACIIDIDPNPEEIIESILHRLNKTPNSTR